MATFRSDGADPIRGRRILVANRGEIACRVLRAIRDEGGVGIAVYSDADRTAPHVRLADVAIRLGPAPAAGSYLNVDRILQACRETGAAMLHPGYGFFSENAAFASAVEQAGIVWIGPPAEAIRIMGDKIEARARVLAGGGPVIPGSGALAADAADAAAHARRIGYPVLVKAAFGGGGKGMRACRDDAELASALGMARDEAGRAFGNATIYLERLIERPRHIEIQILADAHGNVVHLGERECSIQRRHQKVLEESPSPIGIEGLRGRMGSAAAAIAREIGYVGVGTIEFLVDPAGAFYFLEMNTRLQVEHPVTEMTTGIDLVRAQLRVAAGEPLPWRQDEIQWRGHAIECRINAEDPERGFLPSAGWIRSVRLPQGPGVRNDVGFQTGTEISSHYDPMIGKLIVWGVTREQALSRAARAIEEYQIVGVRTNIPFHRWLLAHPRFLAGATDTGFLEAEFRPEALRDDEAEEAAMLAAALMELRGSRFRGAAAHGEGGRARGESAWKRLGRPGAAGGALR